MDAAARPDSAPRALRPAVSAAAARRLVIELSSAAAARRLDRLERILATGATVDLAFGSASTSALQLWRERLVQAELPRLPGSEAGQLRVVPPAARWADDRQLRSKLGVSSDEWLVVAQLDPPPSRRGAPSAPFTRAPAGATASPGPTPVVWQVIAAADRGRLRIVRIVER